VLVGSPVGYPRTCMALGTDDPRMATPQAIGRAVGEGPQHHRGRGEPSRDRRGGERHRGPRADPHGRGRARHPAVVVRAPTWVRVRDLVVYVDGVALPATVLGDAQRDPMDATVRFRGDLSVSVAPAGSWAIVVINGEELTPVYPGRQAFAVSNPIFLQR
jgi:hypothetical protein